ncbi:putative cyclic nucleotide-gated ion channel 15 [Morella rubra]|uniref:Putative cyclic nucleotide-gated ion channel 15 n=1 Tax=Morella rubra TaxID=262757 RepID=A0A6A1WNT6_9ROSI|nr:putative cyclic nucleotide-gated ion channel 15 [Morella rubra]
MGEVSMHFGGQCKMKCSEKGSGVSNHTRKGLKAKVLCSVFSEDYEKEKCKILDPRGEVISHWSKIFLVACLVSLFVDPLFLYMPTLSAELCVRNGMTLKVILTIIRSVADVFYVIQIFVRFHTAYIAPSSRVLGRGELIIEPSKIALRYLRGGFWIDLIAALPIPQVLTWVIIPELSGAIVTAKRNAMWYITLIQYIPRVILIYPLSSYIVNATGIIKETAWSGAAYNLVLYLLASHVSGAWFYFQVVGRQEACWRSACSLEQPNCQNEYFDCVKVDDPVRVNWFKSTNVSNLCVPSSNFYEYGIYAYTATEGVITTAFVNKYFYCLWWGIQTLSSVGQNLATSTYVGEILFTIIVSTHGLVLFALLIGNMQKYLQSTTRRVEEWRIKRTDTEQWMHHRHLPLNLRKSVRQYDHFKWLATRGVDEEAILKGLPPDLRRQIKRHLCLSLVRRVPLFNDMDETTVDAICERLKPTLCTKSMFIVREGDPVTQMLFIIGGRLESYTTNGGRSGFFNSCRIGPSDFCGEELLTWALNPVPDVVLPLSTRTVKSITEVEAFALVAEDLKFVASQFRKLHSKQLRHTFRFYSHQWRTWAACFIQAAWRRHRKLKKTAGHRAGDQNQGPPKDSFWSRYAETLIRRMGVSNSGRLNFSTVVSSLQKPLEPDFD